MALVRSNFRYGGGYNNDVPRLLVPAALAVAAALSAQPALFPLKDIRAGMHGTGRTVFTGGRIDEFQVEILGVLENIGPKESIILARLSGGPLEQTGVMQGMSGSPVYIDGMATSKAHGSVNVKHFIRCPSLPCAAGPAYEG